MSRSRVFAVLGLMAVGLTGGTPSSARAALIGPTPYLSFADSPFAGQTYSYFFLETFEDGLFNVPGVTANSGGVTSVLFPTRVGIDSVDADDGAVDGSGSNGDSFFGPNGATGITFTFNAGVLGSLPTDVGIVWTDGANNIRFEAFDAAGVSLGVLTGTHADGVFTGTTAEDRFYGATNAGGISRIIIQSGGGGIEVDHLQYGFSTGGPVLPAVPEPASVALLGLGAAGLFGYRLRRRTPAAA